MNNTPLNPNQWELVKYREAGGGNGGATCFPTDQAGYMALCRIGAQPNEYGLTMYRGQGWFAKHRETGKWLRLLDNKPQPALPELLTIEYNPSRMLRAGIGQHGTDFMQYFAYVLYGMAADAQNGTTQCSAYLKWAQGIEQLIKEEC